VRRFEPGTGGSPRIFAANRQYYAFSVENLWQNRPYTPPNPPFRRKIAEFTAAAQPSGHTSPAAGFGLNFEIA
jgi:hypothetical protein